MGVLDSRFLNLDPDSPGCLTAVQIPAGPQQPTIGEVVDKKVDSYIGNPSEVEITIDGITLIVNAATATAYAKYKSGSKSGLVTLTGSGGGGGGNANLVIGNISMYHKDNVPTYVVPLNTGKKLSIAEYPDLYTYVGAGFNHLALNTAVNTEIAFDVPRAPMTANDLPSPYVVTASSSDESAQAWRAFDFEDNAWETQTPPVRPEWLDIRWGAFPLYIKGWSWAAASTESAPLNFNLYGILSNGTSQLIKAYTNQPTPVIGSPSSYQLGYLRGPYIGARMELPSDGTAISELVITCVDKTRTPVEADTKVFDPATEFMVPPYIDVPTPAGFVWGIVASSGA